MRDAVAETAARVEHCRAALECRRREEGAWISGDGRVGEDTASALLGFATGTLANRRADGTAPPHSRLGGGGSRVSYSLQDLAGWIVGHRVS